MDHLYTVILAGGAGTRFWPASRLLTPKQLLPLGPDPDEPLLRATLRRIAPLCPPSRTLVATGAHLLEATRGALPELSPDQLLAEPTARNTAACIGWAVHSITRRDPEALVMVFPADHAVTDEEAFRATVLRALAQARQGSITTIGLAPTRPETGYGYIELGEPLGEHAHSVARFIEKPDLARARAFVEGGRHLWNGGMFFFRAADLLAALRDHLPALAEGLERIDHAAARGEEREALAREFPTLPAISIDHGVMEKHGGLAVVPGRFGWSDVGSWESAWELAPKDGEGNAAPEGAVLIDAHRNLVRDLRTGGQPRVVALVGTADLVVIETDDALLIMPRERAQDVRLVVEELRRRKSGAV